MGGAGDPELRERLRGEREGVRAVGPRREGAREGLAHPLRGGAAPQPRLLVLPQAAAELPDLGCK